VPIYIESATLESSSLEELQELADTVGVGHFGLDEDALRQKLVLEGTPVQ